MILVESTLYTLNLHIILFTFIPASPSLIPWQLFRTFLSHSIYLWRWPDNDTYSGISTTIRALIASPPLVAPRGRSCFPPKQKEISMAVKAILAS